MNKLLHLCRREVVNAKRKHQQTKATDTLDIYLDWSRIEGQTDVRLLARVENVPLRILRMVEADSHKQWNPWS